jgi:hypothetical protein
MKNCDIVQEQKRGEHLNKKNNDLETKIKKKIREIFMEIQINLRKFASLELAQ